MRGENGTNSRKWKDQSQNRLDYQREETEKTGRGTKHSWSLNRCLHVSSSFITGVYSIGNAYLRNNGDPNP